MKVLVLGSAGFLMSNFMRYVLYRSKDFDFVSVDRLTNPENIRFVYRNRNHQFYIGDTTDKYFMDRVMYIEKPDIIINGIYETDKNKKFMDACLLSSYGIKFIVLEYFSQKKDIEKLEDIIVSNNGNILYLPNCFGWRQKINSGLAKIINDCINGNVNVSDETAYWSFAEDVASMLWLLMEEGFNNKLYMPSVNISTKTIVDNIIKLLNLKNVEINEDKKIDGLYYGPFLKSVIKWKSDYSDINVPLEKTIKWYEANKWIFNIGFAKE